MSDQIACEPVGPAPPMMNVATPAPLPPPPPPPVVVEKKGRGRPKKTEEEKARDKAKRLLEKNALKGAPKPKSAPTKPFAAKAAKPAVKRVKVSDEDEEGHVPAFAHQQHDDAAALLDDEADEDAADSPVSHQMCPDVDPDLAREKRRSVILRRPVLRIPVVASLAVTAPHGVDDDDDDGNDEDDSTPAWFTAIFNEDLAALKKAVSANSDWAEETHYVNYRPNQVWTAVGFAVERDFAEGVRFLLTTGGVHLASEAFTLDDGPITPLQLAKNQNKAPSALSVIMELKKKAKVVAPPASTVAPTE